MIRAPMMTRGLMDMATIVLTTKTMQLNVRMLVCTLTTLNRCVADVVVARSLGVWMIWSVWIPIQ